MGNWCKSVIPNTRTWEQQERNKTKRQTKMVRREAGMNKRSPDGLSDPTKTQFIIIIIILGV